MPRGHGWKDSFDHIDRRRRTLLRRSLERKNCQFASKEPQISTLILRNTEQRCIVFTLVSVELDAYWKLVQGSELRNYLQPKVSGVDDCEPISPSVVIFRVNLPEEQRISLPESTNLQKSPSACTSSGTYVMGQSRHRRKSKSFNDSSVTSLPRCSEVDPSGTLCESLGAVGSDVLVSDIPILEKPKKRSSRKKGKKKGKQYKRSTRKNVSTRLEGHCEETTCSASAVEHSAYSAPASLVEHISGNLSENAIPSMLAEDTVLENDASETNNDYVDSSTTMISCISYSDELEDSETLTSVSLVAVCGTTSDIHSKLSATCPERIPSFVDVINENTHPQRNKNGNDKSFSITLDQHDGYSALESFQDCWNYDISENCSNDVERRLVIQDKCERDISRVVDPESMNCDPSLHTNTVDVSVMDNGKINDCPAHDCYWPEDVLIQCSPESAECNSQASNNDDFHPVISGKRGRTARKTTSLTGKINNHPVWKKVQKMYTEHPVNTKKNVCASSHQVDFPSKCFDTRSSLDTSDLRQNQKGKSGRYPWAYEMNNQTSKSYSCKIANTVIDSCEANGKRKPTSALKPLNHNTRKASPNNNAALSRPSKTHAQQNDRSRILPEIREGKLNSSQLSLPHNNDSQLLVVKSTEKNGICQSEQQRNREYLDEGSLSENTCSISDERTLEDTCSHTSLEAHSNIKEHNGVYHDLFPEDNTDGKCRNLRDECSHVEHRELDCKVGPLSQKWVPAGRKETVVYFKRSMDNMESSLIDESIFNKVDNKSAKEEATMRARTFASSRRGGLQCSNCTTAELSCSSLDTDKLTGNLRNDPCTDGEFVGVLEATLHVSNQMQYQEIPQPKSDLGKIIHAVNYSYNSQTMVEALHQVSGTPVAEFERFIHSASPVICQRSHTRSCRSCFQQQLRNDSCCWHQIHNITLGNLWQWYEEPGCYGLEVKAEEHCSSKKLDNGCPEFKAYFVPYLSAVQLFARSGFSNVSSYEGRQLPCEPYKLARSQSDFRSLPMFAELLPQPRKIEDSCLLESLSVKDKLDNQSVRIANSSNEELIFEYFEHAQPPQRRPLFEKIKELVNGNRPSGGQIYGDPSKLECMNLHDLHPASWYSVAWYPIYCIPEGNLRSAFLTYHSLGHFLHQSATPDKAGDFTHIVSPVVGLQSYNAKKECWFQPVDPKSTEVSTEASSSNSSKLVEERLRTLEHTASLFATATVRKDNQRCVNNHPDYNHFFSRW